MGPHKGLIHRVFLPRYSHVRTLDQGKGPATEFGLPPSGSLHTRVIEGFHDHPDTIWLRQLDGSDDDRSDRASPVPADGWRDDLDCQLVCLDKNSADKMNDVVD
jgi:hypothetical protein